MIDSSDNIATSWDPDDRGIILLITGSDFKNSLRVLWQTISLTHIHAFSLRSHWIIEGVIGLENRLWEYNVSQIHPKPSNLLLGVDLPNNPSPESLHQVYTKT